MIGDTQAEVKDFSKKICSFSMAGPGAATAPLVEQDLDPAGVLGIWGEDRLSQHDIEPAVAVDVRQPDVGGDRVELRFPRLRAFLELTILCLVEDTKLLGDPVGEEDVVQTVAVEVSYGNRREAPQIVFLPPDRDL